MVVKSLLATLAVPVLLCAALTPLPERNDTTRIVGGVLAQKGDVPFIVSIHSYSSFRCGGSLLDSTTILTAAHCVDTESVEDVTVRAGSLKVSQGGVTSSISSIIVHPEYYSSEYLYNDIAILKLAEPIPEEDGIGYARLAAAGSDPYPHIVVTVAGWGLTDLDKGLSYNLKKIHIPIIPREDCIDKYNARSITGDMVCAGYKKTGSCLGDSGSPLFETDTGVLIGIVSKSKLGCASSGKPGVYTRVGSFRDFIDKHMGSSERL